jgi:molybdate transport system substrate-binding protein
VIKTAIEQGEPLDGIYLGDVQPLDDLQAKGWILPASRKELATTDIVVIALADSPIQISDFRELASDRIKTVAIGGKNPSVGKYTHEILTRLGIAQVVGLKAIVKETDVREVLRAVELGEAQVGITFLPEAKSSTKVKILATASKDLYEPIKTAVAVVKTSQHTQDMQTYLDFLSSDRARAVFQKSGLLPLVS